MEKATEMVGEISHELSEIIKGATILPPNSFTEAELDSLAAEATPITCELYRMGETLDD